jgi:hypothetical protein
MSIARQATSVDGEALAKLVYDETVRRLTNQTRFLDGLRTHTGTLFGSALIATSFFGSQAFNDGIGVAGWIGIICFISAASISTFMFLPSAWMFWPPGEEKLKFTLQHRDVINLLSETTPDEMSGSSAYPYITKRLEEEIYKPNESRLDVMCKGMSVLSVLVGAEMIALTFEFV